MLPLPSYYLWYHYFTITKIVISDNITVNSAVSAMDHTINSLLGLHLFNLSTSLYFFIININLTVFIISPMYKYVNILLNIHIATIYLIYLIYLF